MNILRTIHDKKIVSEYDQEIPQSQTADNPIAPQDDGCMVFAMSLLYNGSMKHCKCLLYGCKDIPYYLNSRDISSYQNSNNRGITAHGLQSLNIRRIAFLRTYVRQRV